MSNLDLFSEKDRISPFLRWAGGKRWLASTIASEYDERFSRYVEPFLGSGAIFFAIQPNSALLSDSNNWLTDTYKAVKEDWKSVERKLKHHDRLHSTEYYYKTRSSSPTSLSGKAAKLIYLNKTCYNGLFRVNLKGEFNVPIGTKERAFLDTDDFEGASKALKRAVIRCADFGASLDKCGVGDFVFADPPYTTKHDHNGFVKYNERIFRWSDQERLAEKLREAKRRGAYIVCTNANHPSVRELYEQDFELQTVSRASVLSGLGGVRGAVNELLVRG